MHTLGTRNFGSASSPSLTKHLPLLLALLLAACQDYRLHSDVKELDDSGSRQPPEAPSGLAGVAPLMDLPGPDTGPQSEVPCDLEPRPAEPYAGSPSCTPMPEVSWELALELEIPNEEGPFASLVVIPGSDNRTLIIAEGADSGSRALVGYDGATGEQVFAHQVSSGDRDGATTFRGSAPGQRALGGTVNAASAERVTIVDIDSGTTVEPAGRHANWTTVARDIDHDGAVEVLTGNYMGVSQAVTAAWGSVMRP